MPQQNTKEPKPRTTKVAARLKPRRKTDWNIMVYVVGESTLSGGMISQLKELTDAGFQKGTTVLAYFDPNCNGTEARIFDVNRWRKRRSRKLTMLGDGPDPYVRNLAEDCHIPELPQLPSALTLRYFLEYARTYYPANNYMVFLMGHGVLVGSDAFLPDPGDNSGITLVDLGWILKNFSTKVEAHGEKFQLVGFHSCSMNSVELIHELAGSAKYMMGTQGSALPGSWPYRQLLKKIFRLIRDSKRTKSGTNALVKELLRALQDLSFYNSEDFWLAGYSADLSICNLDTRQVGKLRTPIRNLSLALTDGLRDPVTQNCIQLAHLKSQSYWGENYTDLCDLCECLLEQCKKTSGPQVAIRSACRRINRVLQSGPNQLVRYSDYYGPSYQYSNGLSIYFPWVRPEPEVERHYEGYSFTRDYKKGSWWDFLNQYFDQTQRELRGDRHRKPKPLRPGKTPWVSWPIRDWLRDLSDEELLKLGRPLGKRRFGRDLVSILGRDPGKILGGDPGKILAKILGGDPGKILAGDPGKILGKILGGDPGKILGGDPGKILATILGGDPGKILGGDPGKILGLYAATVIKNFADPPNKFVSSRRLPFREPRTKPRSGVARKPRKP